jgi:hypoxanthine phosphoribosyltransferase
VIATALRLAAQRDWFSVSAVPSGEKIGNWRQQSSREQHTRLALGIDDWNPYSIAAAGRPVLLLDDVFVTGASMFSYANALRAAGCREIRSVALVRHVSDRHWNYHDALRIVRRTVDWAWSPARVAVGTFDGWAT